MKISRCISSFALMVWFAALVESGVAADQPAADRAVLEIDVPANAVILIDGKVQNKRKKEPADPKLKGQPAFRGIEFIEDEIGTAVARIERHRFEFQGLKKGEFQEHDVEVRLDKDAAGVSRKILLRAGEMTHWAPRLGKDVLPEMVVQMGHSSTTGGVLAVALSPEGDHAVTGAADQTAIVWDTNTGRQLRTLRGHKLIISAVAISPEGKRVATGSWDSTAILWELQTGKKLLELKGHTAQVRSVAFSADGDMVLTGSEDRTLILWDARTGRKMRQFDGHDGWVTAVSFMGDSRVLSNAGDNTLIVWNAQTGEKLKTLKVGTVLAFAPDGKRFFAALDNKDAVVFETETGKAIRTLTGNFGTPAALSADGKRLLITPRLSLEEFKKAAEVPNPELIDLETGRRLATFRRWGPLLSPGTLSRDGKRFFAGALDGSAAMWDAQSGELLQRFHGRTHSINHVGFSPSGRIVTTATETVMIWDAQSKPIAGYFQGAFLTIGAQGRRLVSASGRSKTGNLWNLDTALRERSFPWTGGLPIAEAISPDGKHLVTGHFDKTAAIWSTEAGEKVRTLNGHKDEVWAVAVSLDGKKIVTGSKDKTAMLWDAQTGEALRIFSGHKGLVRSVAISPDGGRVLTASFDGTAMLWDAATGNQLLTFRNHASVVASVAFSPDGRHALSTSLGEALLWRVPTGEIDRRFAGHPSFVGSAAFSGDGRHVVTGGWDGTARLWDIASGEELCRLISIDRGRDWAVVTPEGLFDASRSGRESVFFRVGGGLHVVPLDRFIQDNYYPGLLAALLRGERPRPGRPLPSTPAPLVKILVRADPDHKDRMNIDVALTDQGGGIKGPWLKHNHATLHKTAELIEKNKESKTERYRFNVSLVSGENRFEVFAATSDGAWQSDAATWIERFSGELPRPDLYVLAVGINQYRKDAGVHDLKFCVSDARAIAELFDKQAARSYRQVHVKTLFDEKATRANVLDAVAAIAKKAQTQDTLVLFVAGHGLTVGQRYFLLPHDFQAPADKTAPLSDAVRKTGLAVDDLGEALAEVAALKRVLIFDTCQSGGVTGLAARRNPFAFRGAVERFSRAQGVYCLAASSAQDFAAEEKQLGHGLLTYALTAGLKPDPKGPLGKRQVKMDAEGIDVLEWFRFARQEVPGLYRRYLGRPQPIELSGEEQPGFTLLRGK